MGIGFNGLIVLASCLIILSVVLNVYVTTGGSETNEPEPTRPVS